MRILHTSDWHLGRQLHQQSLLEEQQHAIAQIIEYVRLNPVDVVIIAGDVYDRPIPPASAIELLDQSLNTLNQELNIPIILIAGNHDSGQRLAFANQQLAQSKLYIVGQYAGKIEPITLSDEYGMVEFFPIPYLEPATYNQYVDEPLKSHDAVYQALCQEINNTRDKSRRSVAIAHCFLAGGLESDSERPLSLALSVGGADEVNPKHFEIFNYTALGHLHAPQYRHQESIRYSGSLLKYAFSEHQQKKSFTLIDMDKDGQCQIEQIPFKFKRDVRLIEGFLEDILEGAKNDPRSNDYLLIRLHDKQAILHIMEKLRRVYPNVLHIERPGLMQAGTLKNVAKERLGQGELSLFSDFFQQMTGDELNRQEQEIIAQALASLHQEPSASKEPSADQKPTAQRQQQV